MRACEVKVLTPWFDKIHHSTPSGCIDSTPASHIDPFPHPKFREGRSPHSKPQAGGSPTPLSKTRGGVSTPPHTPSCQRQGTTPPSLHVPRHGFRWSHDAGAFPSARSRRGVPPTQKYERGYPTPLSKKRGGVYPPPLQKVRGGPPPPLSAQRQGTSPPPGAGTGPRHLVESRRRGVFVEGGL
jgi:hypothetical protein